MRSQPEHRIDERALAVWRWGAGLLALMTVTAAVLLFWLVWKTYAPAWVKAAILLAAVLEAAVTVVWLPRLRWKRWLYEVRDEEIDLQYGVWFLKRTIIPMVRVQHVDTKQGPIMRRYGLSSVTFSTAAGSHEIPALDNETADWLRDRIAELAKVSRDDL